MGKRPTGNNGNTNRRTPGGCESAVAGDSLRGHQRRCAEGQPRSSLGKALHARLFFLRLNEISPGLTALPGPGGKRLGSRVPEKDGGMKRRENILVTGPCTQQHHTCACAGGLSSPSGRCPPPGRLGRTARQSVHRRPGAQPGRQPSRRRD